MRKVPSTRALLAVVLMLVAARAADAQEHGYLGGGVTGDWLRLSHTESAGVTDTAASTGTAGVMIRAGAILGRRWGIEGEFVRDAEATTEQPFPPYTILGNIASTATALSAVIYPPIAPIRFTQSIRQGEVTFAATAWYRQPLQRRAALVYHGGMNVARVARTRSFSPGPMPLAVGMPVIVPLRTSKSVWISAGPVVGMELRVTAHRHFEVSGGARLFTLDIEGARGVNIRASAGANWRF